ncbi:MAG: carbon-nitrogen hydrolase family protein [Isosphaeraceae bacterium]
MRTNEARGDAARRSPGITVHPRAGGLRRRAVRLVAMLVLAACITDAAVAGPPKETTSGEDRGMVTLRVAGAQMPVTRDVEKNVATILRAIDFAAREKADVLVTPEGSLSGYTAKFDREATTRGIETVVKHAREARVGLVLGTCFGDVGGPAYDAQRFYDGDGHFLGFHAKTLLCRSMREPGREAEVDHFRTEPLRTFRFNGVTVGGLVCNDLWANPEWTPMPDPYLSRQLAEKGARVVFHSVNAGQDEGEDLALVRGFTTPT